jgi:hypothetical protein
LTWIIEEPHLMTINKIVKVVDLSIQNWNIIEKPHLTTFEKI